MRRRRWGVTAKTSEQPEVEDEDKKVRAAMRRRRWWVTAKTSEQPEIEDEDKKKVISPSFSLYEYKK
jgi:hypothetical protein